MPNTEPGSPSFGYWLRRRRKALDLTQRALAGAVSCSEDAIRKIEADERRPSRRLAERLAVRLEIPGPDLEAFLAAARAIGSIDRLPAGGSRSGLEVDGMAALPAKRAPDHPGGSASDRPGIAQPDAMNVFVGRQRELTELRAAFDQIQANGGRVAMLAGEPGIGKTRTSAQLAAYATGRGAVVLWGRCQEGGGAPAYWPWTQALRAYVRDIPVERLERELGVGAATIAEIVPELRSRIEGLSAESSLDPEAARFRLFDAIASFLRGMATTSPILLVLDDLHWADPASLKLLAFVAGELGSACMLIVGTYRDAEVHRRHPLSATLTELQRSGVLQRTTLRGLGRPEVEDFVARWFGGDTPPAGLVDAIHRQTEGNPLFVSEAVRLLVEEGGLDEVMSGGQYTWTIRIPDGVREVIGRRLDRLSDGCGALLATAAVIGRQFTLGQLAAVHEDTTADQRLTLLDEAIAARVVETLPGIAGQYQFTHALMGEVLVDELPAARRTRLHWSVGEALERMHGQQAAEQASTLVHHFVQGALVGGTGKVVHYSICAGEHALATHAYEEAVGHFERALEARSGDAAGAQSAAILFGLGRAQLATLERHRYVDAARSLRAAFDQYVALGAWRVRSPWPSRVFRTSLAWRPRWRP